MRQLFTFSLHSIQMYSAAMEIFDRFHTVFLLISIVFYLDFLLELDQNFVRTNEIWRMYLLSNLLRWRWKRILYEALAANQNSSFGFCELSKCIYVQTLDKLAHQTDTVKCAFVDWMFLARFPYYRQEIAFRCCSIVAANDISHRRCNSREFSWKIA